ncbi:MAG TPA: hypothetical protein VGD54_03525 [Steroidobacteraceae bacterium]
MANITRRHFLLGGSALTLGCTGCSVIPSQAAGGTAKVRDPAVGQSWHYRKRDLFNGKLVGTELARVSAVGQVIEIEIQSPLVNRGSLTYPSWGNDWLEKYAVRPRQGGIPASEIHSPWGMILMDSHWAKMQVYEEPIPLWPAELRPGWSKTVGTNYQSAETSGERQPWQLTMHAYKWESVTVPAGRFTALRYFNIINFRYSNVSEKVAAQRLETVWFAPEIGRWVARESQGTFYQDVGERFQEDRSRWELLEWT